MRQPHIAAGLREAVARLEARQAEEQDALRAQVQLALDSVQPISLLKHTIKAAADSQELKHDLLTAVLGMGASYVAGKLFAGRPGSPAARLLVSALLFGAGQLLVQRPQQAQRLGISLLRLIIPGRDLNLAPAAQAEETLPPHDR